MNQASHGCYLDFAMQDLTPTRTLPHHMHALVLPPDACVHVHVVSKLQRGIALARQLASSDAAIRS
jgi:hypothetical protein